MSRIILLLWIHAVLVSSSRGESRSPGRPARPPFVAHVDEATLREAMQTAADRHRKAVQAALTNYPVDSSIAPAQTILDTIQLRAHSIEAPGGLPDFGQELARRIFVTETPLLTSEECQKVIQDAEDHFAGREWDRLDSGQYKVAGFWIKDIPSVHQWFVETVATRLFPLLARTFPDFIDSPADLCVDNAYVFKYTPETGFRTNVHTDSGCLSFTLALNPKEDYQGGGTWFEGLDGAPEGGVIEMNEGQVTFRPGGVKHCGHAVQSGTRYIIGGFCIHKGKTEHVRQLLSAPAGTSDDMVRKCSEAALVLNPETDLSYNKLANVYEKAGETAKSRQVLEYCIEKVHPYSGDVAYALASIYKIAKEHEKARACFLACLKCDDYDFEAMLGVVFMSAAMGDYATEREYIDRIISSTGASDRIVGNAYCNLGVLCVGQDEEIACYLKSIELNPGSFAPQYSLGCAYAMRNNLADAREHFKQSVPLATDEEDRIRALKNLYRVAIQEIQTDPSAPSTSQQELMSRLATSMGGDNLQTLTSLTSSS
jgi:tetratricopeptide (TPR) repeat protein